MTEPDWATLAEAWTPARAAGVIGPAELEELLAHAAGYVPAAWRVREDLLGVDLGTGAGVPGVLLALLHPRSRWLLVDAAAKRVDLAREAVAAMGLSSRVEVRHIRAEDLARETEWRGRADLVVARRFGDLAEVVECGGPLVRRGGRLVVSTTTKGVDRLSGAELDTLGLGRTLSWETPAGRYVAIEGTGAADERFPRRPPARRRSPVV